PAVIRIFSEFRKDSREAIVVNETEEVSFICAAEANPASDLTIRSPQDKQIAMVANTNTLIHTLQNTSCLNAGEYTCTCRNNYTYGHVSSSKLVLIVRCPPKLASDNAKDGKIATILHADVTLQFTARNYLDEPNKTTFMWFKENATIEKDDSKFIISSLGLQSNLSITNITQTDFGKFVVRVSNSVGQYIHMYELVEQDKPEAPKNFAYISDSITDSSVDLKWMPGSNGGLPQSFILLYKRITELQRQNISIRDAGTKEMNYTLSGLFSMTEYQVKMFARNEKGDSTYTESLQFTTKEPVRRPIEWHSSTIGIVAGSVSSSVIIVTIAGIAVVVWIYRKRLKQKNKHNVRQTTGAAYETESSFTYDDLDVSKREGNTYSQLPATYEQLDNVTKEGSTYTEMENTVLKREEPDYINIRI
ncbi:nephrin-like, partial [Mercenaria mercenaria]|uniref:nephrin-like n=1 Tax=Mercenaria mercenaria TaxID=6596 RepID=UPI00234F5484